MSEEKTFNTRRRGPGHRGRGEKAKDFKGTWKRIIVYIKKWLPLIAIALVGAVGSTVLSLLGPDKLSELTNTITGGIVTGIDMEGVLVIVYTLIIYYTSSLILHVVQNFVMATVTARTSQKMRGDISKKINRLPMWYFNGAKTGDVLSRVTNDVDTVGQSLNTSIGTLVSAVTLFIGSIVMMFVTNYIMAFTAIGASILGFVFMTAVTRKSQKYFVLQQMNLGAVNGQIEEEYSGHTVVKAYNAERTEKAKFDAANNALKSSAFKAQCLSGMMMPFMVFIGNFGYVAVCVVGAVLAKSGMIGFGTIVAFIIYVRLFTNPLSQMAQAAQSLQSAAAAGERVFAFLDAEELSDESGKRKMLSGAVPGNVEFDHLTFGYEDSDRIIIHDFSASARAGQKIAIVGPTGAGKTTIVNLLMRFNELKGGTIRIEGVPISDMTREEVRSQFCMVLQDTWLFEGTIRENLVYNMTDVPEQKIAAACRAVGLDHFIHSLPHGYDTVLSDTVNLSAGQKQQLTIARAMIADRPILILDEATSSIDTRTELKIQQAMDELMANRTSFVIAHRLSTIKNADLILVLKDGDIIESGTHDSLLRQNGFYAELYNSQFDKAA